VLMQPCHASSFKVVIIGAILLLARRAANNKCNVEPRGRNGHFVFNRSKRIRSKSGAIIVAERHESGRAG
jgi:hypothetical protein